MKKTVVAVWKCEVLKPFWKAIQQYLVKLKISMSFEPDTPFLGIHPNRSKTQVQKDTCTEWLCGMAQRGKNVETKLMPIRGKS